MPHPAISGNICMSNRVCTLGQAPSISRRRGLLPSFPVVVALLLVTLVAPPFRAWGEARLDLKVWVVKASTEQREKTHIDAGLEEIESVLKDVKDVPYNTFRRAAAGKHKLNNQGSTRIPLVARYTLESEAPVAMEDGRYRVQLRITMKSEDDPPKDIEVLSAELLHRPGKQVVVRGLKGEDRLELLLVVCLSTPEKE